MLKCIKDGGYNLTVGKIYHVEKHTRQDGTYSYFIENDKGVRGYVSPHLFISLRENNLKELGI